MAAIAVEPLKMSASTFAVAADSYEKAISGVTFTPSASNTTWKGLDPESVFTMSGKATWVCQLDYVQDWDTANSLSNYLLENEGEQIDVTFTPAAGGAQITASLLVVPGSIGGSVDTFATASVSLPVLGKPTVTPAGS